MRRLIFCCGYDEFYFGLANMTARTVRDSGYHDDLVIFTIDDRKSKYANCINLATHVDACLVKVTSGSFFHKRLCTQFGYTQYSQPYDYFVIKTLPGRIIDRSQYDFILYLDSDILIHPNQSLDEIFASEGPLSDHNSRLALHDTKKLRQHFTPAEEELAGRLLGFGGGAFGVPRRHYHFFDIYREYYIKYIAEVPHDQPVLSFLKIRHFNEHPFGQWANRKFFRHYWGWKKDQMIRDYAVRYGKDSVYEILPALKWSI